MHDRDADHGAAITRIVLVLLPIFLIYAIVSRSTALSQGQQLSGSVRFRDGAPPVAVHTQLTQDPSTWIEDDEYDFAINFYLSPELRFKYGVLPIEVWSARTIVSDPRDELLSDLSLLDTVTSIINETHSRLGLGVPLDRRSWFPRNGFRPSVNARQERWHRVLWTKFAAMIGSIAGLLWGVLVVRTPSDSKCDPYETACTRSLSPMRLPRKR
ncbi:MAG: hypothetical protein AAGI17_04200 [Planctomycetota bacterium]